MWGLSAAAPANLPAPAIDKTAGSFDRAVPVEVTLERALALQQRYGITRIAETTFLDRIGIPSTNVFVPNSRDLIGVYAGKGVTRDLAVVSGLMEALERQICAAGEIERFLTPVKRIRQCMDVENLGWIGSDDEVECVWGTELLTGAQIAVPLALVQCPRSGPRHFAHTSTNGLASGNNPVEALYHALFELCERHLWSEVHVLAHMWPRSLRARTADLSDRPDDPIASEVVVLPDAPIIGELVTKIANAGLGFRLLCYALRNWPIAMQACIIDSEGDELFYHLGMGCSWSPLHAAIRAITEAAQVRLGDISGSREDLKRAGNGAVGFEHGRRPGNFPAGRWYFDGPVAQRVALDELPDRSNIDMTQELRMLLDVLKDFGERCVAYVDLSPNDAPISVARVIAPSLNRTLVDGSLSRRLAALIANPLAPIR